LCETETITLKKLPKAVEPKVTNLYKHGFKVCWFPEESMVRFEVIHNEKRINITENCYTAKKVDRFKRHRVSLTIIN